MGAIPIPFAGYVNFHGDVMHLLWLYSMTARRDPTGHHEDPFAVDAERWFDIKVERTMLGGQWVYES